MGFIQFEIIINVFGYFRYGHYTNSNSFSAGVDYERQNLTYIDVRFW